MRSSPRAFSTRAGGAELGGAMIDCRILAALAGVALIGSTATGQTLPTHRLTAAQVVDADGVIIATIRGDGAGAFTLDSAFYKAYTAASFKNDTLALAERAKGEDSIAPLSKLPHVMFFGGGVPIKLGDETIEAIGGSGAPGSKLDDACVRAGLDKIKDRLQ